MNISNQTYFPLLTILLGFILLIFLRSKTHAHPAGNLVSFKDHLFWSYVYPIDDPEHKACVMEWNGSSAPQPLLTSDYPSSDFFLYSDESWLYIFERRYQGSLDEYQFRILKTDLKIPPQEIWSWRKDNWRIGEAGFIMNSDNDILFCRYPNIYNISKDEEPRLLFSHQDSIQRVRAIDHDKLLLIGNGNIHLTDRLGKSIKSWNQLLTTINQPPLGRNLIFDADYQNEELFIAYWGGRTFERIDATGCRDIILAQTYPLVPHWVLLRQGTLFLFSSKLAFDGSPPVPYFISFDGTFRLIWGS